jgi:chromosome segregation ATPase
VTIKEMVRMVENKQDQQLRFKNNELEQKTKEALHSTAELKKQAEVLTQNVSNLKEDADHLAADHASVEKDIQDQHSSHQNIKQSNLDLEKQVKALEAELVRLNQEAQDRYRIDDF